MNKIIVCSYDEKMLPKKMTDGSACFDMFLEDDFIINPGEIVIAKAGFKVIMPIGWQAQIFARSSLPKRGLIIPNSVAVFDSDFRGDYQAQFYNITGKKLSFKKHSRLIQFQFLPYYVKSGVFGTKEIPEIEFIVDKKLYDNFEKKYSSLRGTGKIGSTGH